MFRSPYPFKMINLSLLDKVPRRGDAFQQTIQSFLDLEKTRKELQSEIDGLRAERNAANKQMAKAEKKSPEFDAARNTLRELSQKIKGLEKKLNDIAVESRDLHLLIPNAPHESVPDGNAEDCNEELLVWGEKPSFDFNLSFISGK